MGEERISPEQFMKSLYRTESFAPFMSFLPYACKKNYPASIILARIIYWNDKLKIVLNGEKVLAKSASDLAQETGVDEQTVGRSCRHLRDLGIVDYTVKKFNKHPVMHLKLNTHVLFQLYKEKVELETDGVLEIPAYLLQKPEPKLKVRKM